MPAITTQAIVLRHADYREHDRMLTLLSPGMGRLEALCRGCKRMGSPLLACSELFALGEYTLYSGRGRMTVTSCQLTDSFYSLRADYEKLQYAAYMLAVTEAAAQPSEQAVGLFALLARSLARLCYGDHQPQATAAAFLIHFASISGYRPRLSHCVRCGRALADDEISLMDIEDGGLVCPDCHSPLAPAQPITPAQARWLRAILAVGIDRANLPDRDAPGPLLRLFVESRLEKHLPRMNIF